MCQLWTLNASTVRVLAGAEERFLPCWATLLEDPASAGEELLERVLKGDCLKRSSRKGLENHKATIRFTKCEKLNSVSISGAQQ